MPKNRYFSIFSIFWFLIAFLVLFGWVSIELAKFYRNLCRIVNLRRNGAELGLKIKKSRFLQFLAYMGGTFSGWARKLKFNWGFGIHKKSLCCKFGVSISNRLASRVDTFRHFLVLVETTHFQNRFFEPFSTDKSVSGHFRTFMFFRLTVLLPFVRSN